MCHCLQNSSRPYTSFCSPDGVSDASIRSSAKSMWQTVIVPTFIPFDLSRYSLRSSRKKLKSVGLITPPCNTPCRFSNIFQWHHMTITVSPITRNSTVCSTSCPANHKANVSVLYHRWGFVVVAFFFSQMASNVESVCHGMYKQFSIGSCIDSVSYRHQVITWTSVECWMIGMMLIKLPHLYCFYVHILQS